MIAIHLVNLNDQIRIEYLFIWEIRGKDTPNSSITFFIRVKTSLHILLYTHCHTLTQSLKPYINSNSFQFKNRDFKSQFMYSLNVYNRMCVTTLFFYFILFLVILRNYYNDVTLNFIY